MPNGGDGEAEYTMGLGNSTKGLSSKGLGQTGIKQTVGSLSGFAMNSYFKDNASFESFWDKYINNKDEILSTSESVLNFINEIDSIVVTDVRVKAKMKFLASLCLYLSIDKSASFSDMAYDNINKAIDLDDEAEYSLLRVLINNKNQFMDSTILAKEYFNAEGDTILMNSYFYEQEMSGTISKAVQKYKSNKKSEAMSRFTKRSLCFVPALLFFGYKYAVYVPPTGWFSFSWTPIYIIILVILGYTYLLEILEIRDNLIRDDMSWKNLMRGDMICGKY